MVSLRRDSEAIGRALKDVERSDEMAVGVESLERRQAYGRERLEALLGIVDSDPMGAENRPHYNNYKPTPDLQEDTVIASEDRSGAGGTVSSHNPAPVPHEP